MRSLLVTAAEAPLDGQVAVPGDKSIGHRALLFGALCDGPLRVRGLSGGGDNRSTRAAIEAMGVAVIDDVSDAVVIHGVGVDGLREPADPIDCGNSGTTMRLLCGILSGQRFAATLFGDDSLSRRPMRRVAEPLGRMGARIEGASGARPGDIYPPLRVHGRGARAALDAIEYRLPMASAQVKSAVLLAGLWADGRTQVIEPAPTRDHTERMLARLGAPLATGPGGAAWIDTSGWDRQLSGGELAVPGDPSSAAFLLAAALIAGAGRVAVTRVCTNPTRTGFLDALAAMGAAVERDREDAGERGEPTADLVVRGRAELRGTVIAGDTTVRAIDEIPVLAVLAARAHGTTEFRDAGELRVKESDRIATTCALLRALGATVDEQPEGFTVTGLAGRPFQGCRVHAHGDHRIAMAAAVAGLAAAGPVRVDDADNVATSFPGFADLLGSLGAPISDIWERT
ncbi:MAG TPA: 3-phosphoshikimate 1-carboxyvinyltransferase [Kofleriaceae bacterium]|nr:3-phosphoshikimate 1-carboxyvinyltransferase [Kofleriaceae bacterium]